MIKFPTKSDLAPMLLDITKHKAEQEWVEEQLASIASILKSDPRQYRAYGVFWWPIKAMLITRMGKHYGSEMNQDILVHVNHLSESEILCAGYANKICALDDGRLYSADHLYDSVDGESETYSLSDINMEELIVS